MHKKVATGPLSPSSDVPPALRALLARATQPNPAARLGTIVEFADGLRAIADGRAIPMRNGPTLTPGTPPSPAP